MADDGKIKFEIDLDTETAKKKIESFKDTLNKVGEGGSSLSGILNGFLSLSGPIAIVIAAIYAMKKALDFTLEGDQIQTVNNQFNALAKDAGVNGELMKDGIEKATKGTVDMVDAMKSANKAIIELGPSAAKIPQLFDLATKATRIYGGETTQNFEMISQAIATGNTRMLRHIGINIDAAKAVKNYASENGVAISSLSQFGKQQAILNAVMDLGNKKFKDGVEGNQSLAVSLKQLWVEIKEFADAVAVAFNRIFGPAMQQTIKFFTDQLKQTATNMTAVFGDGVKKTDAQVDQLKSRIESLTSELENQKKIWGDAAPNMSEYKVINAELEQRKKKLEELTKASKEAHAAEAEKTESGGTSDEASKAIVDTDKVKDAKLKAEAEVMGLQDQNAKLREETTTDLGTFEMARMEESVLLQKNYHNQLAQMEQDLKDGKIANDQEYADKRVAIQDQLELKLKQLDQQQKDNENQVYENQLKQAKNTSEGIKAGFASSGMAAQKSLNDFGAKGTMVFNAVNKGAQGFFKGLGEGSKSAGELMKEAMFGAIADMAENQGEFLLASGIGTYNPVQIAEGGALIALSSMLRSQAGGGSSSSSGGGGGGGGGGAAAPSYAPGADLSSPGVTAQSKKTVSITVQGSYFETAETQRRLVDLLKQENDATDYKFTQIGVR